MFPRTLNLGIRVINWHRLRFIPGEWADLAMESRLGGPRCQYGRCGDENNLLSAVNRIHFSQSFRPYPSHYADCTVHAPARRFPEHTSCGSGRRERTDVAVDDNEEESPVSCLLITLTKTMKYTNSSGRISILPVEV
jgi:hypothetical protein